MDNYKYNYNKSLFLKQGAVLTLVSVFLRLTNIFYRSFLSGKMGSEGLGVYQLIFSVFTLSVTLSTSGVSLAVTRLVSKVIAEKNEGSVKKVIRRCLLFSFLLSIFISLLLFIFSDFLALYFLKDINLSPCLKILSLGLPFMAMCTSFKGYFLALDKGTVTGIADTLEQILTILLCVIFFNIFSLNSIISGCTAAMAASSLGETVSFIYNYISYRKSLKKFKNKNKTKTKLPENYVRNGLVHIALPCTLSSAARSLLGTLENLLIPIKLTELGLKRNAALSSYGILQGMAVPIVYFPSSFLSSFAFLLIPKISFDRETNRKKHLSFLTEKALYSALSFSFFFLSLFYLCSEEFSLLIYNNAEAGAFIRLLAPLVPLMYLDIVVDNLLKGMDKQFDSMKFNMLDAFLRVALIYLFMGKFGMNAYISIIWFSTVFNAALSLNKLIKVTEIGINNFFPLLILLPSSFLSVQFSSALSSLLPFKDNLLLSLIFTTAVSGAGYLFINLLLNKKKGRNNSALL